MRDAKAIKRDKEERKDIDKQVFTANCNGFNTSYLGLILTSSVSCELPPPLRGFLAPPASSRVVGGPIGPLTPSTFIDRRTP